MKRKLSQRVTVALAALLIVFGGFGAALAQSRMSDGVKTAVVGDNGPSGAVTAVLKDGPKNF